MVYLNTMSGFKKERITARITFEIDFIVGGVNHDDRIDSVDEFIRDHITADTDEYSCRQTTDYLYCELGKEKR